MKNIKELREKLVDKLDKFEKEELGIEDLKIYTRTCAAIVVAVKTEMQYKKIKSDESDIEFLETTTTDQNEEI